MRIHLYLNDLMRSILEKINSLRVNMYDST